MVAVVVVEVVVVVLALPAEHKLLLLGSPVAVVDEPLARGVLMPLQAEPDTPLLLLLLVTRAAKERR